MTHIRKQGAVHEAQRYMTSSGGIADRYGIEGELFLRLEREHKAPKKPITLPRVSILEKK